MSLSFFDVFHSFRRLTSRRCLVLEKRVTELEKDTNYLSDKVSNLEGLFVSLPKEIAEDLFINSGEFGISFPYEEEEDDAPF